MKISLPRIIEKPVMKWQDIPIYTWFIAKIRFSSVVEEGLFYKGVTTVHYFGNDTTEVKGWFHDIEPCITLEHYYPVDVSITAKLK